MARAESGAPSVLLHGRARELADGAGDPVVAPHHDPHPPPGRGDRRGAVIPILTPDEMAAVDAAAPEPVEVLIERAGAAVAHHALDAARRCLRPTGRRAGGQGEQRRRRAGRGRRLRRRGVRVIEIDAEAAPGDAPDGRPRHRRRLRHRLPRRPRGARPAGAPVLAVDIPSGIDGTTGEEHGRALTARAHGDVRGAEARVCVLEPGRSRAGRVVVADIGLDVGEPAAGLVEAARRGRVAAGTAPPTAHKWRPALLVVAGSPGMTGRRPPGGRGRPARAAPGMVRLGSPGVDDDPARPTEAVGLELPVGGMGRGGARGAPTVPRAGRSVPGSAPPPSPRRRSSTCSPARDLPAVVDGDGAHRPRARCVERLGHPGAHRPCSPPTTASTSGSPATGPGPTGSPRRGSWRPATGAVVLLKGPDHRRRRAGRRACGWWHDGDARLATAGTGDVLSGMIGALLARGLAPLDAAAAGAWLHARAGAAVPHRRTGGLRPRRCAARRSLDGARRLMARAWADVSLDAIAANVETLRAVCAPAEVCAVVKADGYGHGAVPVARAAVEGGAAWLAVAQVVRGDRAAGRGAWRRRSCCSPSRASTRSTRPSPRAWRSPCTPSRCIRRLATAARAGGLAGPRPPEGRHRDAPGGRRAGRRSCASPSWCTPSRTCRSTGCGPTAPSPTSPTTRSPPCQLERFDAAVAAVEGAGHPGADAPRRQLRGRHRPPASRYDLVRCGIAVYGIAPAPALVDRLALEPAVRLATEVAFVKPLAAGERVSYGLRHTSSATPSWPRCRSGTPTASSAGSASEGQDGADRGPSPPDGRRGDHGPGAGRRRSRQRGAGRRRGRAARRPGRSADLARRVGGPARHHRLRGGVRARRTGRAPLRTAPRLLRRDRGRHHRLRRRDARPRAGRVVAGPTRAT